MQCFHLASSYWKNMMNKLFITWTNFFLVHLKLFLKNEINSWNMFISNSIFKVKQVGKKISTQLFYSDLQSIYWKKNKIQRNLSINIYSDASSVAQVNVHLQLIFVQHMTALRMIVYIEKMTTGKRRAGSLLNCHNFKMYNVPK
jgi:hypothetical protein